MENPLLTRTIERPAYRLTGQPELEEALREDPTAFAFFQAVRLLERLYPDRKPVGDFAHPEDEAVRFSVHEGIAFPASEIQRLEVEPGEQPRMTVNFMGLTGPLGVLPLMYTLQLADRVRAHDTALRDFFDIFNHRIIALFYKAWEKYRFSIAHERDQRDRLTRHLMDLVGIGTVGLQNRLGVPDDTLLYYSGLLSMQPRSAAALQQIIEDHFDVPVEIEQFVGGWYPIDESARCALGDELGASAQLGVGAVVGDEVWDQQARVRVRLGPLSRRRYDEFLPDGTAYAALRSLTRFFSNDQFDFEIQLVLARDEVPPCALGAAVDDATPLGWCSWLRTSPMARDPDETILTL